MLCQQFQRPILICSLVCKFQKKKGHFFVYQEKCCTTHKLFSAFLVILA